MTIKLRSIHHVRFAVPDLDKTVQFCLDFGLIIAARDACATYLRGAGNDVYSLVLTQGETAEMLGLALIVDEEADLHRAISDHGASSIRQLESPGGGIAVTINDPDGTPIDLVFGIEAVDPIQLRDDLVVNTPSSRTRFSRRQIQPERGPAQIIRLGHVGLFVTDIATSTNWYLKTLGLLLSDGVIAGPNKAMVAAFFRIDRGEEWVDHHTIALFPGKLGGAQHLSFEVQDAEAQAIAHDHLMRQGWEPLWGVGRHALGSHVFDIWWGPGDIRFETFSDTDLHNASKPPELHNAAPELTRWGGEMPMEYVHAKGTPGVVGGPG